MPETPIAQIDQQTAGPYAGANQGSAALCSSVCDGCQIHRSGFCRTFKGLDLRALSARADNRTIPVGQPLLVSRDARQVAIVVTGFLRLCRQRANGHRQIIGLICPGELIESSQMTDYVEIEAATEVRICRIHSASAADRLEPSPGFRREVLAARQRMADRMRDHAWALGALRPAEHIALFLLNSCADMPWQPLPSGGGILTMQLPRPDIADYLGTTVETLCRVIGKLNDAGLVRSHGPKHFEIPDLSRLGRFARTGCLTGLDTVAVASAPFSDDARQCDSVGTVFM